MRNIWNSKNTGTPEINEEPSLTQPGMSLTPQQILERFSSGRPMGHIPGWYEFSGEAELKNPLPDISRYDFADQKAYYEDVERQLTEIKTKLNNGQSTTKSIETILKEKETELQNKIDNPQNFDDDPDNDTP